MRRDGKAPAGVDEIQELVDKAWRLYRHTCLWNLRKPMAGDDLSAMIMSLRRYGSVEAWKLASELQQMSRGTEHGD